MSPPLTVRAMGSAARWRLLGARLRTAWPEHGWRDAGLVLAGWPVQLAAYAVIVATFLTVNDLDLKFTRSALVDVVPAFVLVALLPALTAVQRYRLRAFLGADIPRPPLIKRRWTWRGLLATARSQWTWRQLFYHLVAAPALAVGALLAAGLWAAGAALGAIVACVWVFPGAVLRRMTRPVSRRIAQRSGREAALGSLGAVVPLLVAAPRVAGRLARLDIHAASALLGPSELERRVETLAESRAGVVDAADAERRRIERDLHDGAQQRLVSLAMNLGLARESLPGLPDEARQVITEAHEEAKEALAELRTLVRGLHPPILEDRGLDAALSGIAARAPLPVRLRVNIPERAPPTVEAVAYFVVSEALANVAKHASASRAEVEARRHNGVLMVTVTDDGTGGADPSRGTGLAGLAHRVHSVDGALSVSSPPGGPTVITAELPCVL